MDNKKSNILKLLSLFVIIIAGIIAMTVMTQHDHEWTMFLRQHKLDWFKDLMADSLFEGEKPGGGDLAIIFLAITGTLYALAWLLEIDLPVVRQKLHFVYNFLEKRAVFSEKLKANRPYLGFIVLSSLCSALYVVHTTKWLVARTRPKLVFQNEMPFSEWYEYGAHFIANGVFRGSFPSGHTAAVFTFMALAYVLVCGGRSGKTKLAGAGVMIFTILLTISMGIARAMSRAHWVTDSTFIIFANWAVMHVIYFWGLRIPEQTAYYDNNKKPMPLKPFYEIIIGFWLFLFCLGLMCFFIGIRAFQLNNCPWLIVLTPIGLIGNIFIIIQLIKLGFFRAKLSLVNQKNT